MINQDTIRLEWLFKNKETAPVATRPYLNLNRFASVFEWRAAVDRLMEKYR